MLDFNKVLEWLKEYGIKLILSVLVILGLMILILIIKLISIRILKSTDARGQKIVQFIKTIVKYLMIIFAAFIILAIWDFDTTIGVIIFSVFVFPKISGICSLGKSLFLQSSLANSILSFVV